MKTEDKQIIDAMFAKAKERSLDYGYFLLRVTGIEHFDGDPIVVLAQELEAKTVTADQLDGNYDFWSLVFNLSRVANGGHYMPSPLSTPWGTPEISDYKTAALPHLDEPLRNIVSGLADETAYLEFAKTILDNYGQGFSEFFSVNPRYIRDPQFTVTEFYFDDEKAGLRAHHSNGSTSEFSRSDTEATGINMVIDDEVGYFVGMMDELKKEWLINGKPMYEAGLYGKYNADGEWKPIEYTGDSQTPQTAALEFSEDWEVQGIFFYMYTTGFPVIEFVMRTKIELPEQLTKFDNGMRLYRIETPNDELKNEHIYDGWMRFDDFSEQGIFNALDAVKLTLEGLSYTFGAETNWQLKYKLKSSMNGVSTPSKADMKVADKLLSAVASSKDKDSLMAAISWFNLGNRSHNPIIAFVCYYTAIEALARQLAEGKLDASAFFKPAAVKLTEPEMVKEYDKLYKEHYPDGIKALLSKGYFDIHESLNRLVKSAFASVYGDKHKIYELMFNNKTGLVGLRGSIVHEGYSDWDRAQYALAQKNLGNLHQIAYSFIMNVALRIPQGSKPPKLSMRFKHSMDASHPNTTLVVTTLKVLPNKDWLIRPEWLD
jgi:hypothetical protein